jgi:hypothetical protein
MACVREMEALVQVGTVLPRAERMSVALSIVRSAGDSVGVAQCIGCSCQVSANRYHLVPGI